MKAALELSMRDQSHGGGAPAGMGGIAQPAPLAAPEALCPPPDRGKVRSQLGKDPQDVLVPPARSSAKKQRGEPRTAEAGTPIQLPEAEVIALLSCIFGDRPEAVDVERWLQVGFQFSPLPGTEWGLWQRQGGPCGILVPVQAFLLKHLLFGDAAVEASPQGDVASQRGAQPLAAGAEEEDERSGALAYALASMLFNAAPQSSYFVCRVAPQEGRSSNDAAADIASGRGGSAIAVTGKRVTRISDALQLLEEAAGDWLAGPAGVLSFAVSVLLTRTLEVVREDMDDHGTPLIGRFGHCSQEVVNLMLIGEATSNVFDGSRWLGDDPTSGLLVKGVDGDRVGVPPVGYLSELEPMRFLAVGTLYKHPEYPIWVLGSPTHYTLLFSARRADSQLSKEAQIEQKAKKVFVENALDEGGLALASNLGKMLEGLGMGADRLPQATSELAREEVILWEDFRAWTCRQFGLHSRSGEALPSGSVRLFLYDGQDPPGPSLRLITLELNDIDPSHAGGGSEGDALAATLHTRWPNAIMQVQGVAGAALEGGPAGS